jgi:hypothetical protein
MEKKAVASLPYLISIPLTHDFITIVSQSSYAELTVATRTFPRGTARKLAYKLKFKKFKTVVLTALIRMEE